MERVKVLTFCVGDKEDDTVEGRLEGCRCRIHSASGRCLNILPRCLSTKGLSQSVKEEGFLGSSLSIRSFPRHWLVNDSHLLTFLSRPHFIHAHSDLFIHNRYSRTCALT
jgi:hypothetical protein